MSDRFDDEHLKRLAKMPYQAGRNTIPTLAAEVLHLRRALESVKIALSGHPRCDIHPDDSAVTCGWKRAVADVRQAVEEADHE